MVDIAQRIEAYRRELRTLEEELEEQCKDMRFRIGICQNKAYLAEVFSQTFTILSRGINDQRIDNAVCSYIKGQSVGDIASRYGITSERVRQLLTAGVLRLKRATTYEQLRRWNAELRGTVAKLRTENQMLRESIQASGCTTEEIPDELAGILSTKLADMPLSVRAHNCLYSAGISAAL
ncbi:MAG: sigma factor-like helix-turn-helix DNA-binding protein [Alistipes indistinctus]